MYGSLVHRWSHSIGKFQRPLLRTSKEVGPDNDNCTTKIRFRVRLKAYDVLI